MKSSVQITQHVNKKEETQRKRLLNAKPCSPSGFGNDDTQGQPSSIGRNFNTFSQNQ